MAVLERCNLIGTGRRKAKMAHVLYVLDRNLSSVWVEVQRSCRPLLRSLIGKILLTYHVGGVEVLSDVRLIGGGGKVFVVLVHYASFTDALERCPLTTGLESGPIRHGGKLRDLLLLQWLLMTTRGCTFTSKDLLQSTHNELLPCLFRHGDRLVLSLIHI